MSAMSLDDILAHYRAQRNLELPKRVVLGRVMATPECMERVAAGALYYALVLHEIGDWGLVDEDDKALNDRALEQGDRVLSKWLVDTEDEACSEYFYVITEGEGDDRVTTCLLPSDY